MVKIFDRICGIFDKRNNFSGLLKFTLYQVQGAQGLPPLIQFLARISLKVVR